MKLKNKNNLNIDQKVYEEMFVYLSEKFWF